MFHPNIVLLMIGTNDINGNINTSSAPTRLGQLIDEIISDAPNALVVVASIIPIRDDGSNARVPNYNAAIPGQVNTRAAAGKHVVFVDNYAAFIKDTSYKTSLDGRRPPSERRRLRGPRTVVLWSDQRSSCPSRALKNAPRFSAEFCYLSGIGRRQS